MMIEISKGVLVTDVVKFMTICAERTKDGSPFVLAEGCIARLEQYNAKLNESK